ncbi:MAG: ATP-binding protein, partial [Cyanobacteria bacterium J06600_6]
MDLEIALEFVNQVLKSKVDRELRPPETTVFVGTWQGITYEQMADSSVYSANYLMRDVAPKFWKLLSTIFGKNIGKSNLKIQLCKLYDSPRMGAQIANEREIKAKTAYKNWQNAITLSSVFYGRKNELQAVVKSVGDDRCQLIKIWGLSGTGKTLLMKKAGEQLQEQYEVVIWRSLSTKP